MASGRQGIGIGYLSFSKEWTMEITWFMRPLTNLPVGENSSEEKCHSGLRVPEPTANTRSHIHLSFFPKRRNVTHEISFCEWDTSEDKDDQTLTGNQNVNWNPTSSGTYPFSFHLFKLLKKFKFSPVRYQYKNSLIENSLFLLTITFHPKFKYLVCILFKINPLVLSS